MIKQTIRNIILDVLIDSKQHKEKDQEFCMYVSLGLAYNKYSLKNEIDLIYNHFGVHSFDELVDKREQVEAEIEKYRGKLSNLDNPRIDLSQEFLPKWWFSDQEPTFSNLVKTIQSASHIKSVANDHLLKLF